VFLLKKHILLLPTLGSLLEDGFRCTIHLALTLLVLLLLAFLKRVAVFERV
jgi:hypothetical protein